MKKILVLFILLSAGALHSQRLYKYVLASGGGSGTTPSLYMVYSLGELGVREFTSGGLHLSEGFIGPDFYQIIMGLEDYAPLTGVMIQPNPVRDLLVISLPQEDVYELTLYDLSGRQILRQEIRNGRQFVVNVRHLHAGTYIAGILHKPQRKFAALKFVKL